MTSSAGLPASRPTTPSPPAAGDLYLDDHLLRPPCLAGPRLLQPGRRRLVLATSFTVDVNLADGQTHDLELYFLDWDSKGRSEQVQISNAGTGAVLAPETISSFTNGVYLDWKVSGNLVITITRTAGANAVLNGIFIDGVLSSSDTSEATAAAGGMGALSTTGVASLGMPAIEAGSGASIAKPPILSNAGPQILQRSSGGLAIGSTGGPVDAVLGSLMDDADAETFIAHSLAHDLALEQISTPGQQSSRRPRD